MSLKGFHVLFILISIILLIGLSYWAYTNDIMIYATLSIIIAVLLGIYEIGFLAKTKEL